jgi:hypothetical protein
MVCGFLMTIAWRTAKRRLPDAVGRLLGLVEWLHITLGLDYAIKLFQSFIPIVFEHCRKYYLQTSVYTQWPALFKDCFQDPRGIFDL